MDIYKETWVCYQHCAIPATFPHEPVDLSLLENGSIWEIPGRPWFCRWTTNFDCGEETCFWACIKDSPLDLTAMNAKRRYEINKGNRFYTTRVLSATDVASMYDVYLESLQGYDNHPTLQTFDKFVNAWSQIQKDNATILFGVFEKNTDHLCGFAHVIRHGRYIPISSFKTRVSCERTNVNFALMYGICEYFKDDLQSGSYLCDGWRNIQHETHFQDYLEKYFGFRKAYCHLHIRYRWIMKVIVSILYPFRRLLTKGKSNVAIRKIISVLNMEEISRKDKETCLQR